MNDELLYCCVPYSALRYSGSTPGADANTYVLFSTTSAVGQALFQGACVHRVRCDIAATQSGSFVLSKSRNRGVTWRAVLTQAAAPSVTASAIFDQVMEPYYDWKLEWTNGGVAQAYFEADLCVLPERSSADAGSVTPPGGSLIFDDLGGGAFLTDDLGGGGHITP